MQEKEKKRKRKEASKSKSKKHKKVSLTACFQTHTTCMWFVSKAHASHECRTRRANTKSTAAKSAEKIRAVSLTEAPTVSVCAILFTSAVMCEGFATLVW